MSSSSKMLNEGPPSISQTVSSVTDLPIPTQKAARDNQQKTSATPPVLRRPSRIRHRPQDDIEVQSLLQGDDTLRQHLEDANVAYLEKLSLLTQPHSVRLTGLPVEVQEGVIDHLAGHLIGITPASAVTPSGSRNWSTAMRHPRRKQLSDLALVSKTWRALIQERLYRHIKVKGTYAGFDECRVWFLKHPHLRPHVRHFEVWMPVWEVKSSRRKTDIPPIPSAFTPRPDLRNRANRGALVVVQEISDMTQAFQQASHNVTLEDIFKHTRDLFPEAYALTIEGGHGKRTPLIKAHPPIIDEPALQYPFFLSSTSNNTLTVNPNIGSLVLKGAWNIIRDRSDFYILKTALPNLREYHCTYAKPKIQAYVAMCYIMQYFPPSIYHLNICLEGLTSKPSSTPEKWRNLYAEHHICNDIGRQIPNLETLSYTGRICCSLFKNAIEVAGKCRDTPKLKSIDLIVRNCCRPGGFGYNDATGIYQIDFINAFKKLVIEAVRSLSVFTSLHYLRIRFLDLDSPNPLLNPYFHLQGDKVTGIWNDEILSLLRAARPDAEYEGLDFADCSGKRADGFVDHILGGLVPLPRGGRPKSMNVDAYAALAEARI
ncbi:MAG: hypothetical protein LQ339_006873 [Xanthoria mediterranea]|nr:MAG: hypothetical protein LQ339_006873 [Xanthoria mediterranea]